MGRRILGQALSQDDIPDVVPDGEVGIDMTLFLEAARPRWWHFTVVVEDAPATVLMWGAVPQGAPDDATDDLWVRHQDEFGTFPLGTVGTALPIGTYHFITDGLGLYSRIYFQKGAGTVNVALREILDAERGA